MKISMESIFRVLDNIPVLQERYPKSTLAVLVYSKLGLCVHYQIFDTFEEFECDSQLLGFIKEKFGAVLVYYNHSYGFNNLHLTRAFRHTLIDKLQSLSVRKIDIIDVVFIRDYYVQTGILYGRLTCFGGMEYMLNSQMYLDIVKKEPDKW